MSKFSTQHYNAIAADIRAELTSAVAFHAPKFSNATSSSTHYYAVDALVKLALRFAKRFKDENEAFDPLKFLDQCSPNEDLYPLSELWDDYTRES